MIRYILPENGNFYKANLHCHSTCSDGHFTPEQIRDQYKAHGYSIVAYTDHDILLPHSDLRQDDFLPMHGFEIEINEPGKPWELTRTCHLCFVSLDENNITQPIWHRSAYLFGNAPSHRGEVKFDPEVPDFVRSYTPECINEAIRIGKEHGFFVTYNHPAWSLESYPEYSAYEGMDAMEMINYGCVTAGYFDHNNVAYDDLLRQGKKLFCTATDDNHNGMAVNDARWDSFGGYIVLKAPGLTYPAIAKALKAGEFYSSEGPEIRSLWYDEEKRELHVTTSPAARITCTTAARRGRIADRYKEGILVEEATFALDELDSYARITVTDEKGRNAYSNAIFDL